MRRMSIVSVAVLIVGTGLFVTGNRFGNAQQPPIKRTDLLKTDLAGMEGKEMNIWTAEIAPGAATAKHYHPTPRFVIVLEGAVVLRSKAGYRRFNAGQAYQELPGVVHNFKNASATEPAKAIGIQHAEKGQPLQIDVR